VKALVTGITGFVGSHLAEYLLTQGVEVYGTYRVRSRMDHIHHIRDKIHLMECELKDPNSVDSLICSTQPDFIYHLAAQSFVPTSWNSPADTIWNNVGAQINLLEAVRKYDVKTRIQIACSSEEYGLVHPQETPIVESNPLRPLSPYAVSKVAQDMMGYQYNQSYGMHIVRTRTFNHEGPRRGDTFVLSNFAKQVAEIECKLRPPTLEVGNLDAVRDFTDVRDIVRAYVLALQYGEPGEVYNIGSGVPIRIGDALSKLLEMTDRKITVKEDPKRMRPSDVPLLHCDARKFSEKTGWKPMISFEETLRDTLEYWRSQLHVVPPSV
jgi:GDP-4-dehydro-6-deoxy-D-mannose reductase